MGDVELTGTVYFSALSLGLFFLEDSGQFIFCNNQSGMSVDRGDRIRLIGKAVPGELLPIVQAEKVSVIAQSCDLREPVSIDMSKPELDLTKRDCEWVHAKGVVQTISVDSGKTVLNCRNGLQRFKVTVPKNFPPVVAIGLVDSLIEVTGNLGCEILDGEIRGREIFAYLDHVKINSEGNSVAWQPIRTVADLWADKNASSFHLRGQVTYVKTDGYFIETAQSGRWITNDRQMDVVLGSEIDVFGVRELTDRRLSVRMVSGDVVRDLPKPKLSSADAIATTNEIYESPLFQRRIKVAGRFRGAIDAKEEHVGVSLYSDGRNFEALIQADDAAGVDWKSAETVTITGTLDQSEEFDFAVLVPTVGDIAITRKASKLAVFARYGLPIFGLSMLVICTWMLRLRKQVAQKTRDLDQANVKLESSVNSMRDGLLMLCPDRQVSHANSRVAEILGFDIPLGSTCATFRNQLEAQGANGEFLSIWDSLNSSRSGKTDCVLEMTRPGSRAPRLVEVRSLPVRDSTGDFDHRLWMFHDVTDQHVLADSLTHAQKQEAVGQMASGFAHDFNNLLTGITCNLHLATMDPTRQVSEVSDCLNTAIKASDRAAKLVSQILHFSRKRPTHLRVARLNHFLQDLEDLLLPAIPSGIKLVCELATTSPIVKIDENQLEQVLLNICLNACDAVEDRGQITIRTYTTKRSESDQPTGRGRLPTRDREPTERFAVISVHDTGHGMTRDVLEKIFEPFFTTKVETGSGLGLSMTQDIISRHGGFVECDSVPDVGTEFRIYLPELSGQSESRPDTVDVRIYRTHIESPN